MESEIIGCEEGRNCDHCGRKLTEAQIEAAHAVLRDRGCFVLWDDLAAALEAQPGWPLPHHIEGTDLMTTEDMIEAAHAALRARGIYVDWEALRAALEAVEAARDSGDEGDA